MTKYDYSKLDLNKLDDDQLKAHKKAMDEQYHKNIVRPGDAGYQYDKRTDYAALRKQAAMNNNNGDDEEDSWDDD